MQLNSVYVTVGTTKFDALINKLFTDEVLTALKRRGCKKLIIQLGNGDLPPVDKAESYGIEVETYKFKFGLDREDIMNSDLTIGHAGAGTCMDILKYRKPGLVVVNEGLMDNHQAELAEQLANDGYIYQCNLDGLAESLDSLDFTRLIPYEKNKGMAEFTSFLVELMEK